MLFFFPKELKLILKQCLAGQCQKNLLSILRAGLQQSIGMLQEAEETNFYISSHGLVLFADL